MKYFVLLYVTRGFVIHSTRRFRCSGPLLALYQDHCERPKPCVTADRESWANTGGSSGIGLSSVDLLLSFGASVINGDWSEPPEKERPSYLFVKTNVANWTDLI